jgi:hypothetical protein
MSTNRKQVANTAPVGATSIAKYTATPIPKYATWDEHRDAIRRDAEDRRTLTEQRRAKTGV